MKFVVATQDYVGLGFAVRLRDEGHEVILGCQPRTADVADSPLRSAEGDGLHLTRDS